jgi:HEAT repeat protein
MEISIDSALSDALDEDSPTRRESIRFLIDCDDPGIEDRLFALLAEADRIHGIAELCRILAERDPERDPAYAIKSALGSRADESGWWARTFNRHSFILFSVPYGICRLRKAEPIKHYERVLNGRWAMWRIMAVLSLGDTADLRALPPLARGLRDRSKHVRGTAALAVRRIHRDVGIDAHGLAVVADPLLACQADRRAVVAQNARWALADLGLVELSGDEVCPPVGSTWSGN